MILKERNLLNKIKVNEKTLEIFMKKIITIYYYFNYVKKRN